MALSGEGRLDPDDENSTLCRCSQCAVLLTMTMDGKVSVKKLSEHDSDPRSAIEE